jgi:Holliday junction resolvasome RuvABC DNA-binding subunit
MSEQTGLTVNAKTGEQVIAELSKDEIDFIQSLTQEANLQDVKSQARTSALAKLAALGLTEKEIAAL